jgi:hypothetical protein
MIGLFMGDQQPVLDQPFIQAGFHQTLIIRLAALVHLPVQHSLINEEKSAGVSERRR